MGKYKVGDELIIVKDAAEETRKLNEMTKLEMKDDFAKITWGIKVEKVEYDKPHVVLTYKNAFGETNKVFAQCLDESNFDTEKVLEKALLKAFQNEIIEITCRKTLRCNL